MHAASLLLGSLALVGCPALSSPSLDPETGGAGGTGGQEPVATAGSGGSATAGDGGSAGTGGESGSGGASNSAGAGGSGGSGGAAGSSGLPTFPWQPSARSGIPSAPYSNVLQPSGVAGNLRVLDWAGFKSAISYTFDDGNQSQITNYDAINALGVRFSFYLVSSWAGASNPIWARALTDGHEIGNHTASHLGDGSTLAADTDAAETFIEDTFGSTVYTMAAPFGAAAYADIASTRYLINRGATDGLIAPEGSTDPFNLPCFLPPANALQTQLDTKVNTARTAGAWQILLIHGFAGGSDSAFQPVGLEAFTGSVQHAKDLGDTWIDSVVNVGAYWVGQKMFNAVTPQVEGTDSIWTWTLPDHFPSGKYLRVVVDGGRLSQAGVNLVWDPHGYYEIALDQGSLTLSP
jgi:peptidoglycan/xylan/chitin deacetylase (PgdA/CDA1 family)